LKYAIKEEIKIVIKNLTEKVGCQKKYNPRVN